MGIDKDYIIGLTILITGIIMYALQNHVIGGFMIGVGFVIILKSYGKK